MAVKQQNQTFSTLMRRLAQVGFQRDFVRYAILPDWWEEANAKDPNLLADIEIRVARFLGMPLLAIKDPQADLTPTHYNKAQLRKVRDIDRDRLGPAIHAAIQVAGAVLRNLQETVESPEMPRQDGLQWRKNIQRATKAVTLDDILTDLWKRGIPVIPLDVLPSPGFQGMACIVDNRPVILLGYKHDEPGRVAFVINHEVSHVVAGDCAPDQPTVDEDDEIRDNDGIEARADRYATHVLIGSDSIPDLEGRDFRDLAKQAAQIEQTDGADAGCVISAWAAETRDYATATMAWKALYRYSGARRKVRAHFERHVNLEGASDSDRNLLRCVYGDPELNEAVG